MKTKTKMTKATMTIAATQALVKLFNAQKSCVKLELGRRRTFRVQVADRFLDRGATRHLSPGFFRLLDQMAKKEEFRVEWNRTCTLGWLV